MSETPTPRMEPCSACEQPAGCLEAAMCMQLPVTTSPATQSDAPRTVEELDREMFLLWVKAKPTDAMMAMIAWKDRAIAKATAQLQSAIYEMSGNYAIVQKALRDANAAVIARDADIIALRQAKENSDRVMVNALAERDRAEKDRDEYRMALGNRREKNFMDATPRSGLPIRILSSYIEDGYASSQPPELGNMINQWQEERNAILRKAIEVLSAAST